MYEFIDQKIPKRKRTINLGVMLGLFMMAGFFLYLFGSSIFSFSSSTAMGGLSFETFPIFFMLFVMVTAVAVQYYEGRNWHNQWQTIANRMGLFYESYKSKQALLGKWARIYGTIDGFEVSVEKFTRGSGKNKQIYTSITLLGGRDFKGMAQISKKSWYSGLVSGLSRNDELQIFQLGDADFDKRLEVKTSSEQFARNMLSAYEMKQKLLDIQRQSPKMKIVLDGNELSYSERSLLLDGDYLAAVMRTLSELAESAEQN